ncbi:hypothetical protein Gotur_001163 [Gossypium turneri]
MLDKAKQELKSKDDALRKSVENFHNLEDKAEGKDQLCKAKEEKLNELENQLSSKTYPYPVLNTLSICHEPMCTIKGWEVVVMELWGKKRRRNLAGERAKEIRVLQVSIACGAEVAGASELPCLRPLVYKYQFYTVYYV